MGRRGNWPFATSTCVGGLEPVSGTVMTPLEASQLCCWLLAQCMAAARVGRESCFSAVFHRLHLWREW